MIILTFFFKLFIFKSFLKFSVFNILFDNCNEIKFEFDRIVHANFDKNWNILRAKKPKIIIIKMKLIYLLIVLISPFISLTSG